MSAIDQRESWLLSRKKGIGASEIAAVVGMSPYMASVDLWLLKTEQMEREQIDSDLLWFGTALEPIITQRYEQITGRTVLRGQAIAGFLKGDGRFLLSSHGENVIVARADMPWLMCTPDGLCPADYRGTELKNVRYKNAEWGAAGSDEVPDHFRIQTAWQMATFDYPQWDLVPLFSGNRLEVFPLQRDFALEAELLEAGRSFWFDNVLAGVAPKVDESQSYGRYLARKYSMQGSGTVPSTDRFEDLASRLKDASRREKQAKSDKQLVCNELMVELADAAAVHTRVGKIAWVRSKPTRVVDWQGLAIHMGADEEDQKLFAKEEQRSAYVRGYFSKEEE